MNILDARRRTLGTDVFKRTEEGNPVSVKSVARRNPGITMQGWTEQDSTNGYQLFDASLLSSHSAGGATVTNNGDGSFTISGEGQLTSIFNVEHVLTHEESINLLKVGKIRLKSDVSTSPYLRVGIENYYLTTREIDANRVIDITQDMLDDPQFTINLRIYANNADTIIPGTVKPMLYQDGDGTWEPYTGGAPSPSPDYKQDVKSAGKYDEATGKYQYEVKLTGANLFDISKVITDSGLLTNNGDGTLTATPSQGSSGVCGKVPNTLRDFCPELISGETYHLSANTTGTMNRIYLLGTNITWYFGRQRTITDTDLESEVYFYASDLNTEAVISDIMITEVEGADYEPYRLPQTVTLTSDRPLTKWDRLEKRNGVWGWMYKSNVLTYDGNEDWVYDANSTRGEYSALYYWDTRLLNKNYSYCSKFRHIVQPYDGEGIMYNNGDSRSFHVSIRTDRLDTPDANGFKQWLQSNPLTVWYETAEETFVPLSESEQEAMNALYTYRPTTVLSNQQGCQMTLTYKSRKGMS